MMPGMDPKVVTVYRSVGKLLSTYRSGKIPKAFKVCKMKGGRTSESCSAMQRCTEPMLVRILEQLTHPCKRESQAMLDAPLRFADHPVA